MAPIPPSSSSPSPPPSTQTQMHTQTPTPIQTQTQSILPSLSDPAPHAHRLSISPPVRVAAGSGLGFAAGFGLGATEGGRLAALRFRAEHAHRLPTSTKGWYLYHKTKNYKMMRSGLWEGGKMGCRLGAWAGGFFLVEQSVDRVRGERRDFLSTVVAGLSVAGAFSVVNRFSMITAARTAKTGLFVGLGLGLMQDAVSLARGKRLRYVDFILRRKRDGESRSVQD